MMQCCKTKKKNNIFVKNKLSFNAMDSNVHQVSQEKRSKLSPVFLPDSKAFIFVHCIILTYVDRCYRYDVVFKLGHSVQVLYCNIKRWNILLTIRNHICLRQSTSS